MSDNDINIRARFLGARRAAAEAKQVSRGVGGIGAASQKADKHSRKMGRGFVYTRKSIGGLHAGVSGLAGALGFAGTLGLAGAFKLMYDEGRGAQVEQRRLTAVLKSTHGAAKVTSAQVNAYADSLSNMSGIDNDVIKQGSTMLLTFEKVRNEQGKGNDVFKRANAEMVDFASRFTNGNMVGAAKMLGRALNDPTKGLTLLNRAGVSFTKQEQDQIKGLVAHNDLLGAQKLILDKIGPQIKGQAAASTNPVQKLQTALKNVAETLGLKLLPYIDKGAHAVEKWVRQVVAGTGQGGRFRDQVTRIYNAVKPVVVWFARAARNVFKFASNHPGLVKVAAALFLANRALKLMRFGGAIAGAGRLLGLLGKIGRSKAGTKAANEISSGLSATKMGKVGSVAGVGLRAGLVGAFVGVGGYLASKFANDFLKNLQNSLPEPFASGVGLGRFTNPLTSTQAIIGSKAGQTMIDPRSALGGVHVPRSALVNINPNHAPGRQTHHTGPSSHRKVAVGPVGAASDGSTQIVVPVHLDGKQIAQVVAQHTRTDRNRR